jgi:DNA polymerase IV
LVVPVEEELAFLHALPVERLWGVGPVTARKLHAAGLMTVAEVAALPEAALVSLLGVAAGRHLHALAHNRDPRRVRTGQRRRSMGTQRALGRRTPKSPVDLDAVVVALADRLGGRLRAAHRLCRTITLRLRFDDFSRATRSHTLSEATAHTQIILATARELLVDAMPLIRRQGVTLVGLTLANLENEGAVQLALPLEGQRARALDATIDDVRDRFGSTAITRAVLLGRDPGVTMPLLPD